MEPSHWERLSVFAGHLSPSVQVDGDSLAWTALRLVDVNGECIQLFPRGHDCAVTIAKVRRAVQQYWCRIEGISLLFDGRASLVSYRLTMEDGTQVTGDAKDEFVVGQQFIITVAIPGSSYFPADLVRAVARNDLEPVKRLIEAGVDVNARVDATRHGTALGVALLGNSQLGDNEAILQYLLDQPTIDLDNADLEGNSILQQCMWSVIGRRKISFIYRVDVHRQNKDGRNALHDAMHFSVDTEAVEALLACGSGTLALCVDNKGKLPSDADGDTAQTRAIVGRLLEVQRATMCAMTDMVRLHIAVPEIVMSYYTRTEPRPLKIDTPNKRKIGTSRSDE